MALVQRDPDHRWDRLADVVVLGSGAAGMVAATVASDGGADVVLLEGARMLGGTTGVSGGMPWIPLNRHLAELDVVDTREDALTYIRRLTNGREPDPRLVERYVDVAHEMLDYLEQRTPVRFSAPGTFSDYYADLPGGMPRGRSIEPVPFDARTELGDWAGRLRTSPVMPPMTMEEGGLAAAFGEMPDADLIAKRTAEDVRTMGGALVAALFKGLLDRGVEVITESPARELVVDGDGAVIGVRAEHPGQADRPFLVGARRGVVLATGGFEWNTDLVRAFLGVDVHPLSPPGNRGDGLIMAMEAGAALGNMSSAWWYPAMQDPGLSYDGEPLFLLGSGRNFAGSIVVNRHGRRFVNEGATYQDMPKTFQIFDPVGHEYPNQAPVWLIFDQGLKDRAVVGTLLPGVPAPDWVDQAPSIRQLAQNIGVDADNLEDTVARFNEHAADHQDPDFHRGTLWFEGFMTGGPNPAACLRPIDRPPFYALAIYHGVLGTNGGALVDGDARVRRLRGGVIPGLYAAGNAAACVFGPAYPGGGATLGPAMTFGYLAGRHAASQPDRPINGTIRRTVSRS
jgi:succinate dehydrogenase/fumarate reductase flavoprotein subunit